MSYGPSLSAVYGRAAEFVDKILKGAKPADLPVERATKFVAIVNLKTAKAIGIQVPTSLLLRASPNWKYGIRCRTGSLGGAANEL